MIRASIDIGSNSVLLLVADWSEEKKNIEKELLNLSFITSLGKNLDKTKEFCQSSMDATWQALVDYKQQLKVFKIKPEDVIVTATEAARVATNAKLFFEKIKNEIGFDVILISGESEAYYTALGAVSGFKETSCESIVVMDMGGASTELINIQLSPFKILSTISLPVGSVRATDWRNEGIFEEKMELLLKHDLSAYKTNRLVCVAGGMTSLASMYLGLHEYSDKAIDGLNISFSSFKEFSTDLQKTNVENLLLLFPFLGKRAPMLAAASNVAVIIGHKLGVENISISTRGLRYGTLIQGEING